MLSLITFFALILGAITGSFLLVVALRYNTGRSLKGRSACFSCGTTLKWYELVPLASYLVQKGKCRTCRSTIALETLGIEFLTGFIFVLITLRALFFGYPELLTTVPYLIGTFYLFIIFSVLIVIFIYDLHHKIIPDKLSLTFGILALLSTFFFSLGDGLFTYIGLHIPSLWHLLGGIIVPLPFFLLWLVSKGKWIGLGDPKLMVGIGFLLGTIQGMSAVFVSFWVGTLAILSMIVTQKVLKKKLFGNTKGGIMKQEVPFGPFLILGTLLTLVFGIYLF